MRNIFATSMIMVGSCVAAGAMVNASNSQPVTFAEVDGQHRPFTRVAEVDGQHRPFMRVAEVDGQHRPFARMA